MNDPLPDLVNILESFLLHFHFPRHWRFRRFHFRRPTLASFLATLNRKEILKNKSHHWFATPSVVSTIIPGVLLARFRIVNHVYKEISFLSLMSKLFKKVPVEREHSLSMGGAIILIALFGQNYYS